MDIYSISFILGPIILCVVFALCFFLVVGIKTFIYLLKPINDIVKPAKKRVPKKPKPVKSIEIDPDFIDRIYVKKSS